MNGVLHDTAPHVLTLEQCTRFCVRHLTHARKEVRGAALSCCVEVYTSVDKEEDLRVCYACAKELVLDDENIPRSRRDRVRKRLADVDKQVGRVGIEKFAAEDAAKKAAAEKKRRRMRGGRGKKEKEKRAGPPPFMGGKGGEAGAAAAGEGASASAETKAAAAPKKKKKLKRGSGKKPGAPKKKKAAAAAAPAEEAKGEVL